MGARIELSQREDIDGMSIMELRSTWVDVYGNGRRVR